ncbi:MAG TPA: galactokinase [Thermoanaerobaculia bacterium]|nr:galactokinase [Thermoanaerobaculia bacterium]
MARRPPAGRDALRRSGSREHAGSGRAALLHRDRFGVEPTVLVRAPGRVNLLGGHVDYSEGWVLPAAIKHKLELAASPLRARRLELELPDVGWSGGIDLDALPPKLAERPERDGAPSDLAAGVVWALAERAIQAPGAALTVSSDIPIGAGVASSAAFEVALVLALARLAEIDLDPLTVARIGRACENGYLGLASGIMDQYVCVLGEPEAALLLDCRTETHRIVPLPAGLRLLVADSGVRRRLVGSGYGDRAAECRRALDLLRRERPELGTLRDLPLEDLDAAIAALEAPLDRRVRHVVTECDRVLRGAAALEAGDLEVFAEIVRAAHRSLRDDFEVSIPELDLLAETAWGAAGTHGARAFGGGFGGCVVVLVEADAVEAVGARLTSAFAASFGRPPGLLLTDAAPGTTVHADGRFSR